jgi:predicted MFS family arabinose efflux permease
VGRLVIALVSDRVGSTHIYVVLPWVIAVALLIAPAADTAAGGIALFALAGLACSGFFPMTIGYGESSFPGMVELAAGWLIAAYQVGYGLAAFGGGALQDAVSLSTLFRLTAVLVLFMGVLSLPIARAAHPSPARTDVARFTPSGR